MGEKPTTADEERKGGLATPASESPMPGGMEDHQVQVPVVWIRLAGPRNPMRPRRSSGTRTSAPAVQPPALQSGKPAQTMYRTA